MANVLDRNFDFATNGTVTAAGLHNLIDETNIYAGLISTQEERTSVGTGDLLLIANSSAIGSPQIAANRTTVYNLFEDALTGGTYVNAQLSGNLTYGTATGNRTISTGANITNGTISTLIAGTTTSTAAAITNGTITNGTITTALIPTLTAGTTTGTAGIFTSGTVTTLNSTTGTITNLSTTLAGDFTISQGTGTLGTSGVTLGTYGGATSVPVLAIDAKGRITTASTSAITSGFTGFRNRIINGAMVIDQRNAGASLTIDTSQPYTLDRWAAFATVTSKYSVQQNAAAVTPPAGFKNYLGVTSLAATSLGAGDYYFVCQKIEGYNCADLGFGAAGASTVTVSFWVRSSLTGTFGGALNNGDSSRAYPFTYTINAANTWEQKTVTIAGDTSGTWDTTNGKSIIVIFGLGVGSTGSGTAGSWSSNAYFSATGATSVVGTNGATFYITGVQLEAGSTATDFERRPIGTELAMCQRYFFKTTQGLGIAQNGAELYRGGPTFPVTMRSTPTLAAGASYAVASGSAGVVQLLNEAGAPNSTDGVVINNSSNNWSATVRVAVTAGFSSEL